jgi:hypothetical protein
VLLCLIKIYHAIFYHVHITAHNIPHHILSRVTLCNLMSHHVLYQIYTIPYHIPCHHIKHLIIPLHNTSVRYRSMTSGCTWVCQRMPSLPGWEAEQGTCCRTSEKKPATERLRLCIVHYVLDRVCVVQYG